MRDKFDLTRRPWAITESAFEILAGYDLDRCEHSPALAGIESDSFEEKLKFDETSGVAVLDISGPLMPSPSLMARFFLGAVDSVRVERLIRDAAASPSVRALILNINTPGGAVTGTPEIGNAVEDFAKKKTVYGFSSGTVASAGFWLAAPASKLYGTESSRWGSIGVIRPHIDASAAQKNAGVKITLFTSGKHKAAGALQTGLSAEQEKLIQDEVDALGVKFRAHVSKHRPDVKAADMEGQVFYADDAVKKGFVDRIVSNFEEVFSAVAAFHADGNSKTFALAVDTMPGATAESGENNMPDNTAPEKEEAPEVKIPEAEAPKVETPEVETPEVETPKAEVAPESDRITALETKLDLALAALDKLKGEPEPKPSKTAETEAARIAAESGTAPLDVSAAGDLASEDEPMSAAELWEKYESIRIDKGNEAARAFYVDHIEGKA